MRESVIVRPKMSTDVRYEMPNDKEGGMKLRYWLVPVVLLSLATIAMAATFKIITQQAMIRKDKRFFAPVVARVPFGELIEQLERQGDWLLVRYGSKRGWIHISAVEEQKFRLSSLLTAKAKEASQDEVALAGKGFTPEVEKAFRGKNPQMKFDLVDQVESLKISDNKLQAFIQEGKLRLPGGES